MQPSAAGLAVGSQPAALATWSEWGGVASAAQVPVLPQAVVARINRGLSSPKRMGVVNELQREAMNKS